MPGVWPRTSWGSTTRRAQSGSFTVRKRTRSSAARTSWSASACAARRGFTRNNGSRTLPNSLPRSVRKGPRQFSEPSALQVQRTSSFQWTTNSTCCSQEMSRRGGASASFSGRVGPPFQWHYHKAGAPSFAALCEEPTLSGLEGVGGRLLAPWALPLTRADGHICLNLLTWGAPRLVRFETWVFAADRNHHR